MLQINDGEGHLHE